MKEPFFIQASEKEIKREREKAKVLRKSRWWQQKLAQGKCYYCRRDFSPAELTMDHVVPLIRGGKSSKGNLVTVCRECNHKKKYLLPMEWEDYLKDSWGKN